MGKRMMIEKTSGLTVVKNRIMGNVVTSLSAVLLLVAAMTTGASTVFAQNRAFVEIEQNRNMPVRGQSQAKVRGTYGEPSSTTPAVGQPPISRWNYPGFTVYFEYSHVITTVAEQDSLPVKLGDIQ